MARGAGLRWQNSGLCGACDVKAATLNAILKARAERCAIAVVTELATGAQRIVARGQEFEEAFRFDKSGMVGDAFVAIHNPPLRLVMIGAVHIAQSITPIARAAGYDISVIDPRGAFATGARFPDVTLYEDWPQDVLPKIGLDARTGFMALTHDPKIDDPALELALKSGVFYIGALGSKKTQASRHERLLAMGFDEAVLSRIHGPIGLNIGSVGAPEIAISVMAEMTKCLRLGL
jgi:xanthine dehydrogenase accessory factor